VNSCVTEILSTQDRIDVLVNNAGARFIRSTEQASEEETQWTMNLNFHGVVRCTKAVLPSMRDVVILLIFRQLAAWLANLLMKFIAPQNSRLKATPNR
jgi:short-subunit dehydrogenase